MSVKSKRNRNRIKKAWRKGRDSGYERGYGDGYKRGYNEDQWVKTVTIKRCNEHIVNAFDRIPMPKSMSPLDMIGAEVKQIACGITVHSFGNGSDESLHDNVLAQARRTFQDSVHYNEYDGFDVYLDGSEHITEEHKGKFNNIKYICVGTVLRITDKRLLAGMRE